MTVDLSRITQSWLASPDAVWLRSVNGVVLHSEQLAPHRLVLGVFVQRKRLKFTTSRKIPCADLEVSEPSAEDAIKEELTLLAEQLRERVELTCRSER